MSCLQRTKTLVQRTIRVILFVFCFLITFTFCQMLWRFDSGLFRGWGPPLRNAGVESCPACYGLDMCSALSNDDIDYYCSRFAAFSFVSLFGVKNVFFACSQSYGDIVAKRLGHSNELYLLDEKACRAVGQSQDCDFHMLTHPSFNVEEKIGDVVKYKEGEIESDGFGMILCPNTKNLKELMSGFMLDENSTSILNSVILANIWTIVNINPEPIIMKYINNSTEGWPVPKYLGACGRTTFQTYEGEMLANFMSAPWSDRARLAVNLLKAADLFTFNHTYFRFYLTDISLENIVMSTDKMWEPVFVDLENIIVLDKNVDFDDQPEDWTKNHTSEAIHCSNCFAFSSESICRHHLSDHNHYAMCKFIEESILHSIPKTISQEFPDIMDALHECIFPTGEMDRFTLSHLLIEKLETILEYDKN